MAVPVSLDDLEKRMKRLEMNMNLEKQPARRTPSAGLTSDRLDNLVNPGRPSNGSDIPARSHSRNSSLGSLRLNFDETFTRRPKSPQQPTGTPPSLALSLGQPNPMKQNRPSSGLDLSSSGSNSPAMQRKKKLALSYSLQSEAPKNSESIEVNKRLKEAMTKNWKLRVCGKLYNANATDFENMGEIGAGTCGQVYKMRFRPENQIMAVKQMHRSGNNEENKRILMDLDVVQKSDFPHIVKCFGTLMTESHVWICMELMSTCFDKLLKKIKGPIPEHVLERLTVAVVKALNYLKEEHGVIHRDVKPSNILIDRGGTIKLCDFGISGRLVDSKAKTRTAGCVAYMSPERIDPPDPTSPDYDIRADVWSLGVSLVELAIGRFPYSNCTTDFEVLTKVLQSEPPKLPLNVNFSAQFRDFVKLCCTKEVRYRPKYRQLLNHPFIVQSEKIQVDMAMWLKGVLYFPSTFSGPSVSNNFIPPPSDDPFGPTPSLGNGMNAGWETFDR